jgi:hypothetical protein
MPGERQPGERQPGERQPGERQPGERQPGERQPGERQPGERQPGEPPPAERTAARLIRQALACSALGSPLYGGLLQHAARDLLEGGPTAAVLDGHLDVPARTALSLRMMGGVHALVLTGQAGDLARFYPSAGGTADAGPGADRAWAAFREVLAGQREAVRAWLGHPPQTNEVGRGAALAGALCHLVAQANYPVRLFEVGASAGLNLRADRFSITGPGVSFGDPASPVRMAGGWLGRPPPRVRLELIERIGGDLAPVDPVSDAGRLRLCAFVWADQLARFDRLRGACDLAEQVPVVLRTESADETIARIKPEPGTWTVLWHSVMRQYLDEEQNARLDAGAAAIGAAATAVARFAHVSLELVRRSADTPVELATWPGGRYRPLGTAPPHGIPVTWAAA